MFRDNLFFEEIYSFYKPAYTVKQVLYKGRSRYQDIIIFENEFLGRVFVLDEAIMLTEYDEFRYHEMIVHPAFYANPSIRDVLIIGGGDGGTAREVLKHSNVASVDMVELDGEVVEVAKKYLPFTASAFEDRRLNLIIADGAEFVKNADKKYDLVIIDSTDPVGPGLVLFSAEFYQNCAKLLKENGALIAQTQNLSWDMPKVKEIRENMRTAFKYVYHYQIYVPMYPGGHFCLTYSSNDIDIKKVQNPDWDNEKYDLKYFSPAVFKAALELPPFVRKELNLE